MTELENRLPGPRTEEGKERSSQNSFKHGLFARSILVDGETQDEFDRHLYRYHREHNPKTPTEEDLVRHLAETEWRRRRIPALEADSIEKSLESGDPERKFMNTYSIYDQRFNRLVQTTLKTLADIQAQRKKETALHLRTAIILRMYNQSNDISWSPADDGFVFSTGVLDRQINFLSRIAAANQAGPHRVTPEEMEFFIAKDVM